MRSQRELAIRDERIRELAENISTKQFVQKYSYGITILESMITGYSKSCEQTMGRSLVDSVLYRLKTAESIADKLEKKGYEISFTNAIEQLSDLAGVRVVCSFCDDVYRMDEFLRQRKDVTVYRRKDYIRHPKESGYRSVHLIVDIDYPLGRTGEKVRLEVQIRTVAMNYWAKLDHQLCYKTEDKRNRHGIGQIRQELRSYAEEICDIDKKMLALRKRIEEI
nr:GTP pyrophosphokinase [Lachnospiraceae bacterium]